MLPAAYSMSIGQGPARKNASSPCPPRAGFALDNATFRWDVGSGYRETRAVPPFMTRSTSLRLTMVVSPGVVMARAP
jgi:hypothetical protein